MNNDVMIGTWAWGSGYNGSKMIFGKGYDEAALKNTFEKAVELGFLKWDTAAVYGMGSCERLLGNLIKGREDIFISTKYFPNRKFKSGALEKSFAESMERLGIKSADLFWIHKPNNLLENLKDADPEILKGIELISNQLDKSLEKLKVEAYGKAGDDFDPNLHNAIGMVDNDELGSDKIAAVFQTGYKIGDKIIRHAMVQVTT